MRRIALGLPVVTLPFISGFGGCYGCPETTDTFPLSGDGAVVIMTDAGPAASCEDACGELIRRGSISGSLISCQFVGDPATAVECRYDPYCPGGRRPTGLQVASREPSSAVGGWLAELAAVEAASVPAFEHVARELTDHGAPGRLVSGARRSALEEVRHARAIAGLARRYGAEPSAARHTLTPTRTLEEVARDNAVEGCAREAFGALLAARQSAAATDPAVARVFGAIARDEARHALLSYAIWDWTTERLDARAVRRLDDARREELGALQRRHEEDPEGALATALGLPSAERSQDMIAQLV